MTDQTETPAATAAAHPEIPKGPYCYTRHEDPAYDAERAATGRPYIPGRQVVCPHWEHRADKPQQESGYCRLLKAGDWEEGGTMLLWDQVKECGINDEIDEADLDWPEEATRDSTQTPGDGK